MLSLSSCTAQESVIDFYEGLKKRQEEAKTEAIAHFEKALENSNIYIATAAAAELMSLYSAGTEIPAETMILVQHKLNSKAAEKIAGFRIRALEILDRERTAAENAVISGSIAVSRARYGEALLFFRMALNDSPDLFFRHPDLLADLGRTFQYTATGTEGINLFLKWERVFSDRENADEQDLAMHKVIPEGSENLVRFRLLFFAARIARQRGSPHIELFERALPLAPDAPSEQSDACIWYILDSSLAKSPVTAIKYLETYISQWHDDAYFTDVMDKFSREFVLKRQWENMIRIFTLLWNRCSAAEAQFTWIIGRAIEENLLSRDEINRAITAVTEAGAVLPEEAWATAIANTYIRIAYSKSANTKSALYYRLLSSEALDEPFFVMSEEPAAKYSPSKDESDEMQFLLGFFNNNAAQFASRWIRVLEGDLSPDELHRLAESLAVTGQYQESMRLVSLYAYRDGYQTTLRDMELWYPRPFPELVEQYGEETGIDPALLFGLIRTESAFNSSIVSRAGAVGLTQLMPATAEETAARIHRQGGPDYSDSGLDLRDPAVNIHIGTTYLAYLNERMGDPLLALLAYNGGMNRVRRWRTIANHPVGNVVSDNLPPDLFLETVEFAETRNYGRSVMAAAAIYRELYYK
jgi:soluble lytic murein transglycosylase